MIGHGLGGERLAHAGLSVQKEDEPLSQTLNDVIEVDSVLLVGPHEGQLLLLVMVVHDEGIKGGLVQSDFCTESPAWARRSPPRPWPIIAGGPCFDWMLRAWGRAQKPSRGHSPLSSDLPRNGRPSRSSTRPMCSWTNARQIT